MWCTMHGHLYHDFDARDLYNYLIIGFVFLALYTDTMSFLLVFLFHFVGRCCCPVGRLNGICSHVLGAREESDRVFGPNKHDLCCASRKMALSCSIYPHIRERLTNTLYAVPQRVKVRRTRQESQQPLPTVRYLSRSCVVVFPTPAGAVPLYKRLPTTPCNCSRIQV